PVPSDLPEPVMPCCCDPRQPRRAGATRGWGVYILAAAQLRSSPAPKGRRHDRTVEADTEADTVAILASPEGPAPPPSAMQFGPAMGEWLRSSPAPKGRRHPR